jgi:hypothetical protein
VREFEADLGVGSAFLMPRESVPSLLSSPTVLHPNKHIYMHASKMLCQASGVFEALSWNRGVWAPIYPRSCIRTSQNKLLKLSEKPHERAKRLTINRLIAM